jgi:hypothetical protein
MRLVVHTHATRHQLHQRDGVPCQCSFHRVAGALTDLNLLLKHCAHREEDTAWAT